MLTQLQRDYDLLRACQFLYYVEASSILSDFEFDHLEKEVAAQGMKLPVGSDNSDAYDPAIRALGCHLMAPDADTAARSLDLYFKLSMPRKKSTPTTPPPEEAAAPATPAVAPILQLSALSTQAGMLAYGGDIVEASQAEYTAQLMGFPGTPDLVEYLEAREKNTPVLVVPKPKAPYDPRPSSLNHHDVCPSYRNDDDPNKDNRAADEGTLMHEAVETGDLSKLTEAEQVTQVEKCLNFKATILEDAVAHWNECALPQHGILRGGTSDLVSLHQFWNPDGVSWSARITVTDWKMGRNHVPDAEGNKQGWRYAIGAWDFINSLVDKGELPSGYRDAAEVVVHFCSPRLDYITSATFTLEQRPAMIERLSEIVTAALLPDEIRPRNFDFENCKWCGEKLNCPKVRSFAERIATNYPEADPPPPDLHPSQTDTAEQHALNLDWANILDDWCKSAKRHANDFRMNHGCEIPGYSLQAGKRTAKAIKGQELMTAYQLIVGEGLLDPESFLITCETTPSALAGLAYDQALSKKDGGTGKGEAENRVIKLLTENNLNSESFGQPYLRRDRKTKIAENQG